MYLSDFSLKPPSQCAISHYLVPALLLTLHVPAHCSCRHCTLLTVPGLRPHKQIAHCSLLMFQIATAHCSLLMCSDHTCKLLSAHSCAQITPANCSLLTPHVLRPHKQISHFSLLMCSDHTCKLLSAHSSCAQITQANCTLLTAHFLISLNTHQHTAPCLFAHTIL